MEDPGPVHGPHEEVRVVAEPLRSLLSKIGIRFFAALFEDGCPFANERHELRSRDQLLACVSFTSRRLRPSRFGNAGFTSSTPCGSMTKTYASLAMKGPVREKPARNRPLVVVPALRFARRRRCRVDEALDDRSAVDVFQTQHGSSAVVGTFGARLLQAHSAPMTAAAARCCAIDGERAIVPCVSIHTFASRSTVAPQ